MSGDWFTKCPDRWISTPAHNGSVLIFTLIKYFNCSSRWVMNVVPVGAKVKIERSYRFTLTWCNPVRIEMLSDGVFQRVTCFLGNRFQFFDSIASSSKTSWTLLIHFRTWCNTIDRHVENFLRFDHSEKKLQWKKQIEGRLRMELKEMSHCSRRCNERYFERFLLPWCCFRNFLRYSHVNRRE